MGDPDEDRPGWEARRRFLNLFRSPVSKYAGWLVSGTGIQAVVGFGANLVLVRLLLPEEFGRFAVVQANVALAATLINFNINDLVLRLPDERLNRSRLGLFGAALTAESIGIAALALGILTVLDLLSVEAFVLLGGTVAGSWLAVETRLYERRFEYKNLSIIETLSHLSGHVFAVVGAILGWGAIVLYLREPVRQTGKTVGLAAVGALRAIPVRWPTWEDWRALFEEVREFWADGVLAQGFERAVILVVAGLTGERVTGYFFQARRLAIVPHQLLQPITFRMGFNYFSRETSPARRKKLLDRGLAAACTGLLVVAAIAYLMADPLIPWLFGETWRPVVPVFRSMSGVLVGLTLFTTLQAYHMALGRLAPFVALGRGGQYTMFVVATVIAIAGFAPAAEVLGFGLSASFLVPTALLLIFPSVRIKVEK